MSQANEQGPEQVNWVGEQRLMQGYCGRADAETSVNEPAAQLLPTPKRKKKITRSSVVRIAPRNADLNRDDDAGMKSAA